MVRSRSRSRGTGNVALVSKPMDDTESFLTTAESTNNIISAKANVHIDTTEIEMAQETISEKPLKFRMLKSSDIPSLHN